MNNETTAKEYAAQVAKQWDERNPFQGHGSTSTRELTHYLETAFIAGVNHAAARFMEQKIVGEPFQASEVAVFDRVTISEQSQLFAVLDQVAVEAIAGVNETAHALIAEGSAFGHTVIKLHVFRSGQWQILGRECQGEPFVSYTIPAFRQSEYELAQALRATLK